LLKNMNNEEKSESVMDTKQSADGKKQNNRREKILTMKKINENAVDTKRNADGTK
ncbi:hypothetical protein T03_4971, partial [Trichinella britovi]